MSKRKDNPYEGNRQMALKKRRTKGPVVMNNNPFAFPRPLVRYSSYRMTTELKVVDRPQASSFFKSTTPPGQLLNGVQSGAAYYQRIGNKISPLSIRIRGFVANVATAVQGMGRILIILDKQPSGGALPPLTTVLSQRNEAGVTSVGVTANINMDYRDRFVMLRDFPIWFPSCTNTAGVITNDFVLDANNPGLIDMYIKLGKYGEMQFTGTNNPITTADINRNAIYMYLVGTADDTYSFSWTCRFKYRDL